MLHIQDSATLVVTCLDELRDYNQPHMPGLVLVLDCCCCICQNVLLLPPGGEARSHSTVVQ